MSDGKPLVSRAHIYFAGWVGERTVNVTINRNHDFRWWPLRKPVLAMLPHQWSRVWSFAGWEVLVSIFPIGMPSLDEIAESIQKRRDLEGKAE